jgi:hypothetical protein
VGIYGSTSAACREDVVKGKKKERADTPEMRKRFRRKRFKRRRIGDACSTQPLRRQVLAAELTVVDEHDGTCSMSHGTDDDLTPNAASPASPFHAWDGENEGEAGEDGGIGSSSGAPEN